MSGSETMSNILISYRREDSADVIWRIFDRLIQHLVERLSSRMWNRFPLVCFRIHSGRTSG